MHQLFFKQAIGAKQSLSQDSLPQPKLLRATLTKREQKLKKLLSMLKIQKSSLMKELIKPTQDYHMHQLSFKLMLKLIMDTGAKMSQFQDSLQLPLVLHQTLVLKEQRVKRP
jgi:hypothetical protein